MDSILPPMLDYFQAYDQLGLIALVTGLIYVFLAAKGNRYCWVYGIISCSIIAWQDFYEYKLYADAILQIFYVFVGFVGLYKWKAETNDISLDISSKELTFLQHFILIFTGLLSSFVLWSLLGRYTDASLPILDSTTSVFAVFTTILLLYKIRSNWIYWIGINTCYIYIYTRQDAYFFASLSGIYLILAVYGFVKWRRR